MFEMLFRLNKSNKVEEFLHLIKLDYLKQSLSLNKDGKILIIGQSDVKVNQLLGIIKNYGLDKSRFEFVLEYAKAKTFNFRKLQYQDGYDLVMVGPMPHSCTDKDDYSSMIERLKQDDGFPPVIELGAKELKITKTNFKEKIEEAILQHII